jgi:hypothetical protein
MNLMASLAQAQADDKARVVVVTNEKASTELCQTQAHLLDSSKQLLMFIVLILFKLKTSCGFIS